jgi:hypothetical protein
VAGARPGRRRALPRRRPEAVDLPLPPGRRRGLAAGGAALPLRGPQDAHDELPGRPGPRFLRQRRLLARLRRVRRAVGGLVRPARAAPRRDPGRVPGRPLPRAPGGRRRGASRGGGPRRLGPRGARRREPPPRTIRQPSERVGKGSPSSSRATSRSTSSRRRSGRPGSLPSSRGAPASTGGRRRPPSSRRSGPSPTLPTASPRLPR